MVRDNPVMSYMRTDIFLLSLFACSLLLGQGRPPVGSSLSAENGLARLRSRSMSNDLPG